MNSTRTPRLRRRLALLVGICVTATCATTAFAQESSPWTDDGQPAPHFCGKAHALAPGHMAQRYRQEQMQEYRRMLELGLREAFDDTDLLHCDVEIEVLPGQYDNLAGTNTMTIQSKSPALTQFTFRLRSQYTIDAALVNGTIPVTVSTIGTTTRVADLDRAYFMDEVLTLTITYHGHAESRGFGSIEFATHSGQDIVYTLSESYYSYTWWPIKDGDFGEAGDNSDKFTLDLAVIAPDTMVTASNGLLLGIDALSGNRERYRWSSDYPICPYLVCFSSTNYNTWTEYYTPLAGGSMPVLFYIYPEDDNPSNRAAWGQVVQMIEVLRDLYGEYPFVNEKYGIYECQFGGGMEHQTFTAQGTFSERVTVHELGHQWWGDLVTCKTWHDIWLNEGFATYTEALWTEFKPGSAGLPDLKASMAGKKYCGSGSVYVTSDELDSLYAIFDGNTTYNKASWVVHMLRHILGDTRFFDDFLTLYRSTFAYSAASTADFQAVCETVYGDSLDWFFQQWVFGEYCPAYEFGWDTVQVAGLDYLLLYIDQTQSASYQRFTMPLDVVVDGTTFTVFNDADPEHFVIPIAAPAASVQLDPDAWVLWSSRTATSYVPGPPKIVATAPVPGASFDPNDAPDTLTITFHTGVSTTVHDYSVVGDTVGSQPIQFAYDGGTNTVTITTPNPLPLDDYTLTIKDTLRASNSNQFLDGEIADPADPASLPSGDGVQGGSATIRFSVGHQLGDVNCDGVVDFGDINPFVDAMLCSTEPDPQACWDAMYPDCDYINADTNNDGQVTFGDINPFVDMLVS